MFDEKMNFEQLDTFFEWAKWHDMIRNGKLYELYRFCPNLFILMQRNDIEIHNSQSELNIMKRGGLEVKSKKTNDEESVW